MGLKIFQQRDFMGTKMWIERAIDLDFTIHDRKWPKIKVKDSCHCIGNSLCSWLVQQLLKQLQVMKNSLFVPFNEQCSLNTVHQFLKGWRLATDSTPI